LRVNGGASHKIVVDFHLGAVIDAENDGQPTSDGDGDDLTGTQDDEDGVAIPGPLRQGDREASVDVHVTDAVYADRYVDAWIDFNSDGDWNDDGERVFSGWVAVGGNTITFSIPNDAVLGDTHARFRLSTTGNLAPTGQAADGEVEDYQVEILSDEPKRQIVTAPASVSAPAGVSVDFPVQYETSTGDTPLTGLGLRMHYDSSFLSFDGLTDVLPNNFIAQQGPMDDVEDFDNDPNTDEYVLVAWSDPLGGSWPNEALPVTLFDTHLHFVDGLEVGATTDINFSASSTAAGYEFDGQSITAIVAPPVNLDVDDNCVADPLTDGVLIMRYLFGFTGEELVRDALAPDARRTDPGDVVEFLDDGRTTMLDADDDGQADALTDGVLILRFMFGFTGEVLVENALADDARRTDPDDIADFLRGFLPTCSAISPTTTQSPFTDIATQLAASGLATTTALLPVGEGEATQNLQIVTSAPDSQIVAPGEQVSIDISYSTSPDDPTLMGLGLRMHFNSAALSFADLSDVLATNLVAQQAPQDDTLDYDNDPSTDQFVLVAWSDPFGVNWPGSLPTTLYTATFTAGASLAGETAVNFSASSTTAGFELHATSVQIRITDEPPNELLDFRLETADLAGNPISSVVVGQEFLLSGFVRDLRPQPAGVFAAYVDVAYDPVIANVSGVIVYGPSFPNVLAGDTSSPGVIDEVGAVADAASLGDGEFLLFSVPLLATEVGQASFAADPADLLPEHQSLLFGLADPVPASHIIFGTTAIDIRAAVHANDDSAEADEDHAVHVAVLANDVGSNLTILAFDSESEHGATVTNNGDGTLRYDPRDCAACQALVFDEVLIDSFTYTIRDTHGATDTATVSVTVEGVNDAPTVANPIPDRRVMPTLPFSFTIPDDTFVDVEDDALSYSASIVGGAWLTFDAATRTFSGTPTDDDFGVVNVTVTATDDGEPRLSATDAFSITVYNPYRNPDDSRDVNGDGLVTPLDVLTVINDLNRNGSRELPIPPPIGIPPLLDVSNDLHVSPIDALMIINRLNESVVEGEAPAGTVNPDAADRLFSEENGLTAQADTVPPIPISGAWHDAVDDLTSKQDPMETAAASPNTGQDSSEPATLAVRPTQADSAILLDESSFSLDGSIELETDLALDELVSETLTLLA